jgi:hypothetical protein
VSISRRATFVGVSPPAPARGGTLPVVRMPEDLSRVRRVDLATCHGEPVATVEFADTSVTRRVYGRRAESLAAAVRERNREPRYGLVAGVS